LLDLAAESLARSANLGAGDETQHDESKEDLRKAIFYKDVAELMAQHSEKYSFTASELKPVYATKQYDRNRSQDGTGTGETADSNI